MIPGAKHNEVLILLIMLLQRGVGRQGTVEIFLVPPAAHHQRRHVSLRQVALRGACFPVVVIIWMRHKSIPGRQLALELVGDLGKGTQLEIPIVGILIERNVCVLL